MEIEIIDLTKDDPPVFSPSLPMHSSNNPTMIPNFGVAATSNHNLHPMVHSHQTAQLQAAPTYDPSEIVMRFYSGMHPGQFRTVLETVPEATIFLFPTGVKLREPWSQREHELYVGLIKFGNGRWGEIGRHFVCSRTPQQVLIYEASFFRHHATTCVVNVMRRNPPIGYYFPSNGNHMSRNRNCIHTLAPYSMPITVPNQAPQETVTLFPGNDPSFQIPPSGGQSTSNNVINGDGPSTSMIAGDNGEIDLELRLGCTTTSVTANVDGETVWNFA